jgi:beta-glucosidase
MSRALKTVAVVVVLAGLNGLQGVVVATRDLAVTAREGGVTTQEGSVTPVRSDLPWMNVALPPEQRADLLIAQMTLEQKVQQISNDTRPAQDAANRPAGCTFTEIGRHIQGIPELGIPTFRMINGGTGVRGGDCGNEPEATALPSTVAGAATFNPALGLQLGDVLGDETRLDGHQVMLAPSMNLHRHPYGGRNYEYQSEDPYLSGVMAAATIKGIQAQGIHATAKHFAGNEQETQRRQMATVVPPRALHELYLLPFEMSVRDAQPAAVMCAFPEINGVSACSSQELLKTTLRERWGFQGYVVSDRRAVHDLGPSIKAGVDWELSHKTPLHYSLDPQPGQRGNPGSEGIRAALKTGTITVSDIDQMLRRRYIQMFKFGQFENDFDVMYAAVPDFAAQTLVAREIAEQSIVLLKNQNDLLPLKTDNLNSIALIGAQWFAGMAKLPPRSIRGDNVNVIAPFTITPKKGLENVLRQLGSSATVTYNSAAGGKSARDAAVELAKKSDVVIVMVGDNPHELCDRETLRLPVVPPADPNFCAWDEIAPGEQENVKGQPDFTRNDEGEFELPNPPEGDGTKQERLMRELVAAPGVAQKMVVVLKTEGMVLMPWLDKVPALVEAWYPGQEDGTAVADILLGVRNPSGKLPVTFGNSAAEAAYSTTAQFPGLFIEPPHWLNRPRLEAQYTEGLQVGYRWYEANNVKPVFPFGFGLSYTTFAYSALTVTPTVDPQTGRTVLGVTYTVTNTGSRAGAEGSQVYVTLPAVAGEPSKRLVGFQKVDLASGANAPVTITIDPGASNHPLSYWVPANNAPPISTPLSGTPATGEPATNTLATGTPSDGAAASDAAANASAFAGWSQGGWSTPLGDYVVLVGSSSEDLPLQQTVTMAGSADQASCAAVAAPAADWVCVGGGWFPPAAVAPRAPAPALPPNPIPSLPSASTPQLLTIDAAHLASVRESLGRGETQYQSARTALESDANVALRVEPMSVVNKPVTPPSGNKHDYMSQAPYWWPDPSKRNGRPYIRRDGVRNPEIDRITDRKNLERLADSVSTLGLGFYFTGREEYAQHAAQLVRVWFLDPATRMNPNLKFGQGIPGRDDGRAAGIVETRFLPEIIDGVMLLQRSAPWSAADDAAFTEWMRKYLAWLLESPLGRAENRRGNNQETWYDVQVAALAIYTGQPEVARTNFEGAKADIREEFEPDGRQPRELARTRAWDYSVFNLTAFVELAEIAKRVGVDLWNYTSADGRSLRKGIDFLIPFATGEERFTYQQISEFRPTALYSILRRAAAGLNEPRYRDVAEQIGGGTPRTDLTVP